MSSQEPGKAYLGQKTIGAISQSMRQSEVLQSSSKIESLCSELTHRLHVSLDITQSLVSKLNPILGSN